MIRGLIGFILLIGACSVSVFSQEMIPGFSHRQWTIDDGLPINEVFDVKSTNDGYIWLSTFDGLVRFDGNRFVTFSKSNTSGLASNRAMGIVDPVTNDVWFLIEAVNQRDILGFYDTKRFTSFQFEINPEWSLISPNYFEEEEVRIVNNFKIYSFDGTSFIPYQLPTSLDPNLKIYGIESSATGGMWISTEEGVKKIDGEKVQSYTTKDGLLSETRNRVFEDSKGRLWANTDKGINFIENGKIYSVEIPENNLNLGFITTDIFEDLSKPGRITFKISHELFMVYFDGQIQLIPATIPSIGNELPPVQLVGGDDLKAPTTWLQIGNNLFNNGKLVYQSKNRIHRILDDKKGGVWIASPDGLHHYKKNLFSSFSLTDAGLTNIYPLYQNATGTIWASDLNGAMFKYRDGNWQKFQALLETRVFSIFEDSKERLWLGDRFSLWVKDSSGNEQDFVRPASSKGAVIKAIYEDKNTKELWFGGRTGVVKLDSNNEWKEFNSTVTGESVVEVRTLNKSASGKLWIGNNGTGLFYMEDGAIHTFEANDKLSDNVIRSFYEDEDGIIWVGMENGGLNRIEILNSDHSQIEVMVFNRSNGLYDDVVHVILEDDYQRLWMSGNRGIFWVYRENLNAYAKGDIPRIQSTYYLEEDGLPGNEANGGMQSTGFKNSDGTLWFSMVGGIAVVNPNEVPDVYNSTPTIIESLSINDSSINNLDEELTLEKSQRDIQIAYTGFNYQVNPKNIQFRYKLQGKNSANWIVAGNRREAFFTNLSAGEYTFTVQASVDGTRWEASDSSLSFKVLPYFHETGWFILLLAIGAAGFVYSGFKFRTKQFTKRQQELTSLVNERTNDLTLEKIEVERQKEVIEKLSHSKDRFFANISHELRTPLTLVLGPLKKLQDSEVFKDEKLERLLSIASKNGMRLQELVEQVLDVTRLDSGRIKTSFETLDVLEYLNLITESFQSQTDKKGINLFNELPAGKVLISADRDKLQKIIINLISNALKFTPKGGSIKVALVETATEIELSVKDTGIGIEPERLSLIFDRFHSNDRSDLTSGDGLGIGLHLTKELIDLHHGTIQVESELKMGTTFTVMLPKNQGVQVLGEAKIEESEHKEINLSSSEMISKPTVDSHVVPVIKILLLEDNEDMRMYISDILSSEEVQVIEAGNGVEGQKRLMEGTPDLIISDVMMPDMDGFEFARFVRSKPEYRLTPLVMLTALSGMDDRIQAFDIGVSDYLNKPFNEKELKARITNLLALKAEREEAQNYIGEEDEIQVQKEAQNYFVLKLKAYIKERISESEITSDELCAAVNMSRRQLFRKIKTETGFTPAGFVREIKLLEARALIETRTMETVSEISFAVGFATPAHFTKIYEERFGVHPKELIR